jgi:hypothetical protein
MGGYMVPATKAEKKAAKLAEKQRALCGFGTPQTIGKPGGTGGKNKLSVPMLPVMRVSVIPNGNNTPTAMNAARAKDLRRARNAKIRAAKNTAE